MPEPISFTKHEYGVVIDIDALTIDLDVQRALMPGRVRKLTKNWDPAAVGELLVFADERNGGDTVYEIGDGQHRKVGAKQMGARHMDCEVFWGVSKPDQARLFLMRNDRTGISKTDKNRNLATMQDAETLAINAACQQAGLVFIGNKTEEVTFGDRSAAVSIIHDARRRLKDTNGYQHLAEVLSFYTDVWAGAIRHGERVEPVLLKGLSKLYLRKPDLDTDWLASQIQNVPPQQLVATADTTRQSMHQAGKSISPARAMALVLAEYYNRWGHKTAGKAIKGL